MLRAREERRRSTLTPVQDLRESKPGGTKPSANAERVARGSDFTPAEIQRAAAAVRSRNEPTRESIVLREARHRRDRLTPEAVDAWVLARVALESVVQPSVFALWFAPLDLEGEHEGALLLSGPGHVVRWIGRRYPDLLNLSVRQNSDFDGVALEAVA